MNPEQFSDALNYLDDDLIQETDALRLGGGRVRRPKIIRWLIPAACVALILGFGSRLLPEFHAGNFASMESDHALAPGLVMDSENVSEDFHEHQCDCSATEVVQQVDYGGISLYIPEDWTYTLEDNGEDSRYIVICHPKQPGSIRIGWDPAFGVCGTGLTTEETVVAGLRASVGTYDGKGVWSYISFLDDYADYVVVNDGADAWCMEAMDWLHSVTIDVG